MNDRPLTPWWGTENMETDEMPVTSCGKTVDPAPIFLTAFEARVVEVAELMTFRRRDDAIEETKRKLKEWQDQRLAAYKKYFGNQSS